VSLELEEHRFLIGDERRTDALARAIAKVVRPGDVVIDLASGTGVLGLMACRAGASRVYCIEQTGIIELARRLARANRCDDRMRFVPAHSSWAALPELADVVVCDQIGHFGFEAGLVESLIDVRNRLLRPGGAVMPARLTLRVGLVEVPSLRAELESWNQRPAGFDFTPARTTALNSGHPTELEAGNLLSDDRAGVTIDLQTTIDEAFGFTVTLTAKRAGTLDGIGGWFVAELAEGVTMSNAPTCPDRIARRNAVFPVETPAALRKGDEVTVAMKIRPSDLLVQWVVTLPGGTTFRQSTLRGMFIEQEALERTRPSFVPHLTPRGIARRTVLALCDGRPLAEIEREVFARHRELFRSEAAAQAFVAEVVTRYCV
jgi:protein arginine N-methyltransferase 1